VNAPEALSPLSGGTGGYAVQFESIGGLGAQAAAKLLAGAAVLKMGLDACHYSSTGRERKGSPVASGVRLAIAGQTIRTNAPVETPNAIVVFHAALLHRPSTFSGLLKDGTLIYNAPKGPPPAELAALPATARVIRVDALGIAAKEQARPGAALLGALCAALPFLDAAQVVFALIAECGGAEAQAAAATERAFRRGVAEFELQAGVGQATGDLPVVAAGAAAPGAGIMTEAGSSVWNDVSAARSGTLPVFNRERCIHCGLCDLVCPDYCLVWEDGEKGSRFERELTGVDYRYCKGCMRCVESCPASAMTKKTETPGLANRLRVPLFPDLIE
jgi:pyruvate ferredoxin oxidoreductase gamma subunit